jgi:hypothetical protein
MARGILCTFTIQVDRLSLAVTHCGCLGAEGDYRNWKGPRLVE